MDVNRLLPTTDLWGTEKASGVTSEPHDAGLRSELFAHEGAAAPKAGGLFLDRPRRREA
jgi:hypothetical protein